MFRLKQIRMLLLLFMAALFISGMTAIPIKWQLEGLMHYTMAYGVLHQWLQQVLYGYTDTATQYPYLLYGYDWLAYAHFILAILFIGPYRDPAKNIWVIQFGMIACCLILPTAFIAGYFRGIPFWWQLIDCSFGVFGFVLLSVIYVKTKQLNILTSKTNKL